MGIMKQLDFQRAVMASDLNSTCKWLFIVIGSHVKWPSGEAAFPSISTLAKESGLSKATIHRAKLILIEEGYLVSTRRYNKSNTYTVHIPVVSERDLGSLTMRPDSLNMRPGSLTVRASMSQNEELTGNLTGKITDNLTDKITDKKINNSFNKELLVKSKIKEIQEGLIWEDTISDTPSLSEVKAIASPPQNLTAEQKDLLAGEWR
jgi:hypothetical protein